MTPPKIKKLFICYSGKDAVKVDKIAHDLALLKYDDGSPRYITWQDKHNLPPASPNWWDAIVDAIENCDMFVFHLSHVSLMSEVCRAELEYAHKRNRPIIPVILEGEFFLNAGSGKYDLPKETWALMPEWLGQTQFLFYVGAQFYGGFQSAVELFERKWPRDIPAPRPLNPDSKSVHGSNHALYSAACDYAERLAFADAEKHFDALVRRNDPDYRDAAAEWLELIRLYAELIEIDERRSAVFLFKKRWSAYAALFPKEFLEGLFDPKGFATRLNDQSRPVQPNSTSKLTLKPVIPTLESKPLTSISVQDILAPPFKWIEIPAGEFTMGHKDQSDNKPHKIMLPTFWIAKYPVTNAQYAKFIETGGYHERKWWTDEGWQWRGKEKRTQPRYWTDKRFNGSEHPVSAVSWYEAVAFTQWISEVIGENVMLPLEAQWEKAARGAKEWLYPWGDTFDMNRCNTKESNIGKTSPIYQYEGRGDSPYGVVDMAGNVWEWCLDEYDSPQIDPSKVNTRSVNLRVLRGGSFKQDQHNALSVYRLINYPNHDFNVLGFRLALDAR